MEDPEFDNKMVQTWAAAKTNPALFNEVAGELASVYILGRSRWRKFSGRLPRRRRIERRKKFVRSLELWDKRKGNAKPGAFLCGECSSYIDIHCNRYSPTQETFLLKAKGCGKGKLNPRHSGNPFGPDGKRLKCHICKSETHLSRWCPQNKDGPVGGSSSSKAGKGPGK